jgi:DNA-directed RNA polymerase subunit RPC12/RpoP
LILIGCVVIKGFSPKSITKDKVMSDSHIYYRCPSCLTKYQSALEKSGSPINCPSCRHYFLIPSKSTFIPDQDQQQQSTGEQQPKLIDCPDCGASISRLATACPKCGRPNNIVLDNQKANHEYSIIMGFLILAGLLISFIRSKI